MNPCAGVFSGFGSKHHSIDVSSKQSLQGALNNEPSVHKTNIGGVIEAAIMKKMMVY